MMSGPETPLSRPEGQSGPAPPPLLVRHRQKGYISCCFQTRPLYCQRDPMENWIGIGVWIVMGALIGLTIKAVIRRPEATQGHTLILMVLGAFAAVVGGMLGVGLFAFEDPQALSPGGMAGAVFLSTLFTTVYRWGVRGLI